MNNQLLKSISLPLLAGLAIYLTGCATVTPESAAYINAQKVIISQKPMSLLTDACVTRQQLGPTIMLINPSEGLAKVTHSELLTELGKRNIKTNKVEIPFVCAVANHTAPAPKGKKIKAFNDVGGQEVMPQGQFFTPTGTTLNQNQPLQAALSELISLVSPAPYQPPKIKYNSSGRVALNLNPSMLNTLQAAYGSNYLWFHTTNSSTISPGLAIAGSVSLAATSMIAGSAVANATTNSAVNGTGKGSTSTIYVFDLGTGEYVYSASTTSYFPMLATKKISSSWASSLLNKLLTPSN